MNQKARYNFLDFLRYINALPFNSRETVAHYFKDARIILADLPKDGPDNILPNQDDIPLDLPFTTCFFEGNLDYESFDFTKQVPIKVMYVLVREMAPNNYYFNFSAYVGSRPAVCVHVAENINPTWLPLMKEIVRRVLDAMKANDVCTERTNIRLKAKTSDGINYIHKIKEVIHVVPKGQQPKKVEEHSVIDWTHRWEVRGHWRKTDGIGKDRSGQYGVKGFTWVNPHSKGPEDKLLVKKIRTFKGVQDGTKTEGTQSH
jgi:hypothetical protein